MGKSFFWVKMDLWCALRVKFNNSFSQLSLIVLVFSISAVLLSTPYIMFWFRSIFLHIHACLVTDIHWTKHYKRWLWRDIHFLDIYIYNDIVHGTEHRDVGFQLKIRCPRWTCGEYMIVSFILTLPGAIAKSLERGPRLREIGRLGVW